MASFFFAILIIALAALIFNIDNAYKIRRRRVEKLLYANKRAANSRDKENKTASSDEDIRTIELIGETAYRNMNERIEKIMCRHSSHRCLSLNMTCGPDTKDGSTELHHILPGEEVKLILCSERGLKSVDVYHNGIRIGRLTLLESQSIRNILTSNHIRGAYVAEQNCYEIDALDLRLIIFYEQKNNSLGKKTENYKFEQALKLNNNLEICQN